MTLLSLFLGIVPAGSELLLILFVIILLFGAKRIPDLAKGLGKGIREFKDATKEEKPQYRDRPVNPNDPSQPRL